MIPNENILSNFAFDEALDMNICTIEPIVSGHINHTFVLEQRNKKYIVQKINTGIFKDPCSLMENIDNVTEHIRRKTAAAGGDTERSTLEIIKTNEGNLFYTDSDGACWRCYRYIKNSVGLDTINAGDLHTFYVAGAALGDFQKMLMDFDASILAETIPLFHDTKNRFRNLEIAIEENRSGRLSDALSEIDFAKAHKEMCSIIVDKLADGSIPLRVTHNDTKLSNILADKDTQQVLCLIDLDTVMPGSALYDFGDALRSAASSGAEDEKELSKIYFRQDIFEEYCKGYLSVGAEFLTDAEIDLLAESVIMMTFECGIRFLSDFLDGDVYFATAYPEHNLVRAGNQFKLVADMEEKLKKTKEIVALAAGK